MNQIPLDLLSKYFSQAVTVHCPSINHVTDEWIARLWVIFFTTEAADPY